MNKFVNLNLSNAVLQRAVALIFYFFAQKWLFPKMNRDAERTSYTEGSL
jgi:hypothetical protein